MCRQNAPIESLRCDPLSEIGLHRDGLRNPPPKSYAVCLLLLYLLTMKLPVGDYAGGCTDLRLHHLQSDRALLPPVFPGALSIDMYKRR